jgi:hypothetical protein
MTISCGRLGVGCAIVIALALTGARTVQAFAVHSSVPEVSFESGDLVLFNGSTLQCLGIGPYGIPGKSGLVCFRGSPKHIYANSYAAAIYEYVPGKRAARSKIWPNDDSELKQIFSENHIGHTHRVQLNAAAHLSGTSLTCFYYVSAHLHAGHRGVACYPTDSTGPLPGKNGIFIDDAKAGTVDVDSARQVKLSIEVNQHTGHVTVH